MKPANDVQIYWELTWHFWIGLQLLPLLAQSQNIILQNLAIFRMNFAARICARNLCASLSDKFEFPFPHVPKSLPQMCACLHEEGPLCLDEANLDCMLLKSRAWYPVPTLDLIGDLLRSTEWNKNDAANSDFEIQVENQNMAS